MDVDWLAEHHALALSLEPTAFTIVSPAARVAVGLLTPGTMPGTRIQVTLVAKVNSVIDGGTRLLDVVNDPSALAELAGAPVDCHVLGAFAYRLVETGVIEMISLRNMVRPNFARHTIIARPHPEWEPQIASTPLLAELSAAGQFEILTPYTLLEVAMRVQEQWSPLPQGGTDGPSS